MRNLSHIAQIRRYNMKYLKCFEKEKSLKTSDGKEILVFNFNSPQNDDILDEWARHFRDNYRTLAEVDDEIIGTGKTRDDYYINDVFPDAHTAPGPSTRVGDFCELMLADYIEYIRYYYVPRTRYCRKINRNMSPNGSDVLGFKMDSTSSLKDEVLVIEVKGGSDPKANYKGFTRLNDALIGSEKDIARYSESLNAIKRRLLDIGDKENAKLIARFQNKTDRPYLVKFGAAAVLTNALYDPSEYVNVSTSDNSAENLELILIHNNDLKSLISELYWRAANVN